MKNYDLHSAKKGKKDEFYTQLTDIEKEVYYYWEHFKGKTVLCNCDDPLISNFFRYFAMQFEHLKLKKLIATCYRNQQSDIFSKHEVDSAVYLEYHGDKNDNRIPDINEIAVKPLKGNGDFRSDECIGFLKEADIVCTNPPFSLFREYIAQLIEYDKKFLIIGNVNAITYRNISPLIKDNKIWLGPSISSGDREFQVPNDYPITASGFRIDEKGNKFIRVKGVRWYTNLPHKKRNEELILTGKYKGNEDKYPKYDNYDAIEVSKVVDIPEDYDGVMGVPITFLDKYNPKQFEIVKCGRGDDEKYVSINGRIPYYRILIRRK